MRHEVDLYTFPGVLAPSLSLDLLLERNDSDRFQPFDIPDDNVQPLDEQVDRDRARVAVNEFVHDLSERDQLIVIRLFWWGDTQSQIAADLGVSNMAVSKAKARILRRGRHVLVDHQHIACIN